MKDGNTKVSRNGIIILFSVLGVIILGLIVAIVVVCLNPRENEIKITQDANTDCLKKKNEYADVIGYPYNEIMDSYEAVMSEHDGVYNISYSVCMANYLYSTYKDIDSAIDIMSEAEKYLVEVDEGIRLSYYSSFEYFFRKAGNEKMANYYYDLIKESLGIEDEVEEETTQEGQ
ncbi:hypothetical protein IKF12_02295 [Candidatus Saccharibacteria bacterium]|nr:hypothetical protein [Candidatus Saccharibacteria bacterium]